MDAIGYYIALPFIYLLAYLPFPLLYFVSDIFYVLIYYVFRYRRGVVYTNLKKSFPEKTEKEIHEITKKFYKYFCDLTLETFKTLTFSKEEAIRRCKFHDHELFQRLYEQKQSILSGFVW